MVPQRDDTANLFSPTCPSMTHIAFATYRLEAQYAIFGHSCGAAAALAVATAPTKGMPVVQSLNVTALQALLVEQGQLIHAKGPHPPAVP